MQYDLSVVEDNQINRNGTENYHQGIVVNANGVSVSNNMITNNAGVRIDFGDCRKCTAKGNHIEENGWIGIEINSSEQITVTGNVLNFNFKGESGSDLQTGILVRKGDGGYLFNGDTKNITITGIVFLAGMVSSMQYLFPMRTAIVSQSLEIVANWLHELMT